jgi:hypothetical protein
MTEWLASKLRVRAKTYSVGHRLEVSFDVRHRLEISFNISHRLEVGDLRKRTMVSKGTGGYRCVKKRRTVSVIVLKSVIVDR